MRRRRFTSSKHLPSLRGSYLPQLTPPSPFAARSVRSATTRRCRSRRCSSGPQTREPLSSTHASAVVTRPGSTTRRRGHAASRRSAARQSERDVVQAWEGVRDSIIMLYHQALQEATGDVYCNCRSPPTECSRTPHAKSTARAESVEADPPDRRGCWRRTRACIWEIRQPLCPI